VRVGAENGALGECVKKLPFIAALFLCTAAATGALTLEDVSYSGPDASATEASITADLRAGIELFYRTYGGLAARNKSWLDTAVLSAGGSNDRDEGFTTFYLRLDLEYGSEDDRDEESFAFRTNPAKMGPKEYAQALRNLALKISDDPGAKQAPPELVRRFSVSAFLGDIPYGGMLPATAIAALPDGRIAIGHSMYATIVDPMLRISDTVGKELSKAAKYTGYNLRASPAGTLLANMSGSGDVVLFNPPDRQARTVATGVSSIETYAWLGDGTLVVKEMMTSRVVAVEQKKRRTLVLSEFDAKYETASFTAGPDGSLISFNPTKRFISWYDKNGNLLNRIIPALTEDRFATVRAVAWLPNGNYFLTATNFVCMLDSGGEPVWILPLDSSLGTMIYEAVWSESDKSVYMIFPGGKTVCQFMDATELAACPVWIRLQRLDREMAEESENTEAVKELADYYLTAGADDYALSLYQTYSQYETGNREVQKTIARLKADQLLSAAAELEARVRTTIRDVGPESAKADYSAAMGAYEQALAQKPGDQEIIRLRAALARVMKDAEAGLNTPVPPLTIEDADFPPIFPALLSTYATSPAGRILVRNTTGSEVRNVRASFFIPRFMDYPAEAAALSILADGEGIEIPLYAAFSPAILGIEEDLPVQAKVRLEWTIDGTPYSLEQNPATLIYRRTALSWDDSGKLASFVTPNEDTIATFAMVLLEAAGKGAQDAAGSARISPRIQRAEAILSGLSALKLRYLEDPQSPLSAVIGKPVAVDTVRFPRTTLFYRGGDCDDTTALLSSLFEAVGIPTAILTTPGHVFLAFNSGLPVSKGWMLEPLGPVLPFRDELWIPLESTVLDRGLEGSWTEAGKLTAKWKNTAQFEFLPLADLRSKYPAIPLPSAGLPLERPDPEMLASLFRTKDRELAARLYDGAAARNALPLANTADETKRLNRLGILHGTFGNLDAALASFSAALRVNPAFHPAMLNIANLYYLRGDNAQAQSWLSRAEKLDPGSAAIAALRESIRGVQKPGTEARTELLVEDARTREKLSTENRGADAQGKTELGE